MPVAPVQPRSPAPRQATALLLAALVCVLSGCGDAVAPAAERAAPAPWHRFEAATAAGESPSARDLKAFILNALLVPLLDSEGGSPARWADPSFSVDCDDARVTVDGVRPDVNAPVPDTFTVRWQMARCTPLGAHLELSGEVELHVETGGSGYSARVVPQGLTLHSAYGVEVLSEPFTARMPADGSALAVGTASASLLPPGS